MMQLLQRFWPYVLLMIGLWACNNNSTTRPQYRPLTESVYASGTIEAEGQYKVYAVISGIIEAWKVEENDVVEVGDTLAIIQSDQTTLNAENARLQLEQARENAAPGSPIITELELNVQSAKTAYVNDSVNYYRKKKLMEQNIGSKAELEQFQLKFETSKNQYIAAKKRLALRKDQLQTELQTAENLYAISRQTASDFVVTSKIAGRVYALYAEEGEVASPQMPLAQLGAADAFLISLLVDELDVSRVQLGQKVLLTLDSYGDQVFEAEVRKIYPVLDERTQTITVEAGFTKAPEVLYPGLTVEANIVVDEKERALVIPTAYLTSGDSVLTEGNGKQGIEIGLRSMEYVEVLSGLDTNSVIRKPDFE